MKPVIFGATANKRYRVTFGPLSEYFCDTYDAHGKPYDYSKMRGLAWYVWTEELYEGEWEGDIAQYGLAPTRRAAIAHAKSSVGC